MYLRMSFLGNCKAIGIELWSDDKVTFTESGKKPLKKFLEGMVLAQEHLDNLVELSKFSMKTQENAKSYGKAIS
jgi:hypothetical protein